MHYNLFYDPLKHDGPILPPAAALAPTLWPQFHLRWSCPTEAQAAEAEAECRKMAFKFSELQKVIRFIISLAVISFLYYILFLLMGLEEMTAFY